MAKWGQAINRRLWRLGLALACGWLMCDCGAVSADPTPADAMPPAVAVGKGSYAAFPPPDAPDSVRQALAMPLRFVALGGQPVPTNKWWTDLIVHPFAGQLWAFPLMVKPDEQGLNVFFPIHWNDSGSDPVSDNPLQIHGADFHPTGTAAKAWGDWDVSFRESDNAGKYWDVTLGRGMPCVWVECHGVAPVIPLSNDAALFDSAGNPLTLPAATDRLGITYGGRSYAVFVPDGTQFTRTADGLACAFSGAKTYLVVCPLPKREDMTLFARYAFAIPRDTRMTWTYSPQAGTVTTNWHIETEALKGTERRVIQGWLPHHYMDAAQNLDFSSGLQYLTPRGTLKCAVGTDFRLVYPFHGFLPTLPAPRATGLPHDFNEARMRDYLTRYATRTDYGDDTYWGGKSLTQLAEYLAAAKEMHDPSAAKLQDTLTTALTDWFTYTPGEKAHFFARYPRWHALIGFQPSYGSEQFNDNHFHYGYFTTAAAMLGMYDPQFLTDYGPIARLVAKEYANWDRADTDFPYLRCFDVWEGHSWASGLSSPTGPNQESSSEAVQSWGGLFLLGTMLGDKDMTAAGAMGYAMETQAAREYWFNVHGTNFAPNNPHPITGMVWGGGDLYGTYFSGDPAWIWGINWLPMTPMLSYLVQDPDFARQSFRAMLAERAKTKDGGNVAGMGTGLGNVILGEAEQVNPDWTADQMDALWDANDPIMHDNDVGGLMYYDAHAHRDLGDIQWDYRMSIPTSCVYKNARTGVTSYVVYNPLPTPQQVIVYHGAEAAGVIDAPPRTLVRKEALSPVSVAAR